MPQFIIERNILHQLERHWAKHQAQKKNVVILGTNEIAARLQAVGQLVLAESVAVGEVGGGDEKVLKDIAARMDKVLGLA